MFRSLINFACIKKKSSTAKHIIHPRGLKQLQQSPEFVGEGGYSIRIPTRVPKVGRSPRFPSIGPFSYGWVGMPLLGCCGRFHPVRAWISNAVPTMTSMISPPSSQFHRDSTAMCLILPRPAAATLILPPPTRFHRALVSSSLPLDSMDHPSSHMERREPAA